MTAKAIVTVLVALVAGCGGMERSADVDAYQRVLSDALAAVETHAAAAIALAPADCGSEMARYEAEMRPMLDRMAGMSDDMDACMADMGRASAEMQATCEAMRAEVDAHRDAACTTGDIAGGGSRHASAMRDMIQREMDASAGMQGMMDGTMMSGRSCHR